MDLSLEKLLDVTHLKRVHTMATRYYLMVNPVGDIVLALRMTGPLPSYTNVQLLNERGTPLYPEGRKTGGVMRIGLACPQEPFSRIEISEEQFLPFQFHSAALFHHYYDAARRKITLRPGHHYVDGVNEDGLEGNYSEVIGKQHLVRRLIAYGGRPMYQLKWYTAKTVEDFPALLRAGLFFHKPREEKPLIFPRRLLIPAEVA